MQATKVDITKLRSVQEYADLKGVDKRTVYYWMSDKEKKLNVVEIRGKKYIHI